MFPRQPVWSNTRINLLQRCPRAFVLRYGLATISRNHPQGQLLSEVFSIQTPWILMHQTVRETVLDFIEDSINGTTWSDELIQIRFKMDFNRAILKRNQIVNRLQQFEIESTHFQVAQAEDHLIAMGTDMCINLLHHPVLKRLLSSGSIERKEPTDSMKIQNIRLYCSPDFIHHGQNGVSVIKFHFYGQLSRFERKQQAALLQIYAGHNSSVIQFTMANRKWDVQKTIPVKNERIQAIDLVQQDLLQMERSFADVSKNNDLSKVALADSYRACMSCNVRFMCPSRHGHEHAKAEQRTLMCE